jgi:hypothetical protein
LTGVRSGFPAKKAARFVDDELRHRIASLDRAAGVMRIEHDVVHSREGCIGLRLVGEHI